MRIGCLIIFTLLLTSCYKTERDCSDFKTGTFEFRYSVDGEEKIGTFVRTNDLNIDYYENKVDSASVRWINDCEYVQVKLNPLSKREERAIHMKILSTTDSSYTFEYNFVGKSQKQRGTAYKTK